MDMKGKIIVITGAAQGLGRTMAIQFAACGVLVIAVDINQEKLEQTVALCEQAGGKAQYYTANIASEAEVVDLFTAINKDHGRIDGLINNAGIVRDGLLVKAKDGQVAAKMTLSDWQAVIDVNLTGVFLCTREAVCAMIENEQPGVIINISSISRSGNFGQSNYTATKAGVASMTVTWAKELSRHGIRVGAIAPGYVNTEMTKDMKPETLDKVVNQVPLKRLCEPDEIALSARYIFENEYFTGRVLECDGGLRI